MAIVHYLSNGLERPELKTFTLAGNEGVDESNVDEINDALYEEQQTRLFSIPLGTPISTKQDIQDFIDQYLGLGG